MHGWCMAMPVEALPCCGMRRQASLRQINFGAMLRQFAARGDGRYIESNVRAGDDSIHGWHLARSGR